MPRKSQAISLASFVPKGMEIDPEWCADAKASLLRVSEAARGAREGHPRPKFKEPETVPAMVDDPYSDIGEKRKNERSVRDDPLADMYSRSQIDTAQYAAGRTWQKYHEITQIGPIAAIDPGKEAVDGGRMRDPITDKQIDAFREIMKADRVLGNMGAQLMRDLLGHRMTVGQMCDKYDCKTGRKQTFLSIRVRECLDDLGKLWGLVG